MLSHADLQRENPMRPLDWQWERAKSLVADRRRYHPDRDDAATGIAMKFIRARRRWGNSRLGREMPHVWHAVQLHELDGPTRWLIESRILARQSIDEIAMAASVTTGTVEIYERLFFDVTDRLDARIFISKQAIRLTGAGTCENHSLRRAAVLRWFGYYGGPIVLDVVAQIMLNTAGHSEPGRAAKVNLLASLLTLPLDGESSFKLLPVCLQLIESTRLGGSVNRSPLAGVSEQIIDQVTEILDNRVVEDAVNTDSQADDGITEAEIWEAA